MAQTLPHPIMYSAGQQVHYLPQYYSTPYAQFAPSAYPERTLKPERRRPKYTRSKTGCLTCRRKKVKCDETKQTCQRCTNSQLECVWPEVPPPKKKGPLRKRVSAADDDSPAPSDAGTSSLSPTAMGYGEGTPHPPFVSAPASPEDAQGTPLSYHDPNMLHAGAGASSDRRHSEPNIQTHLEMMQIRRRSMEHQRYGQSPSGSALGLTLNQHHQMGGSTRPSTPNDFLYPQSHAHQHGHQHAHPHAHQSTNVGYANYSPAGSVSMLPGLSSAGTSASVSSRPSTASSLSLSHSFARRTSAGTLSRPSTAGSLGMSASASTGGGSASGMGVGVGGGARAYAQCADNSAGGNGNGVGMAGGDSSLPLGFSPFSFQLHGGGARGAGSAGGPDVSLDAGSFGNYAPISRPSTANSATSSPFLRHVTGSGSGADAGGSGNGGGAERWQPSPLLGHSPLVAPHPHAPSADGYFPPMMHSPAPHAIALSRRQSPSPAWNY